MRYLIFSDTHRMTENMMMVIRRHGAGADGVVHLGDVVADVRPITAEFAGIPLYQVPGNNDFGYQGRQDLLLELDGHVLFLTHGHRYGVRTGTERLRDAAREKGADIVLYGHTHIPYEERIGQLHIFNPGSISRPYEGYPSYGIMDLSADEVRLTQVPIL